MTSESRTRPPTYLARGRGPRRDDCPRESACLDGWTRGPTPDALAHCPSGCAHGPVGKPATSVRTVQARPVAGPPRTAAAHPSPPSVLETLATWGYDGTARKVAARYRVPLAILLADGHPTASVGRARCALYAAMRSDRRRPSYPEIGRILGRDHTTIIAGVKAHRGHRRGVAGRGENAATSMPELHCDLPAFASRAGADMRGVW